MEKESSRYNFLLRNVIASWKTHEDDLRTLSSLLEVFLFLEFHLKTYIDD